MGVGWRFRGWLSLRSWRDFFGYFFFWRLEASEEIVMWGMAFSNWLPPPQPPRQYFITRSQSYKKNASFTGYGSLEGGAFLTWFGGLFAELQHTVLYLVTVPQPVTVTSITLGWWPVAGSCASLLAPTTSFGTLAPAGPRAVPSVNIYRREELCC